MMTNPSKFVQVVFDQKLCEREGAEFVDGHGGPKHLLLLPSEIRETETVQHFADYIQQNFGITTNVALYASDELRIPHFANLSTLDQPEINRKVWVRVAPIEEAKVSKRSTETASQSASLTDALAQLSVRSDEEAENNSDLRGSDYEEEVNLGDDEGSRMSASGHDVGQADDEEDPPVDLLPHEIVLSSGRFDHILEQIFSYLDTPALLTCRLVSHRFLNFAKAPLEENITLLFHNNEQQISSPVFWQRLKTGRTLEQLTTFMEQPLSSSTPDLNTNRISFPCTSFRFEDVRLGDAVLERFLNINGANIQRFSGYIFSPYVNENFLIHQLSHLFTVQAPNMTSFTCGFLDPIVEWEMEVPLEFRESINENSPKRSKFSPLLQTDPEYKQIQEKVKSLRNKSGLRVVQIYGEGFAKVLEFIIKISPKLNEVVLHERSLMYVLYPENRVHLLKRLRLEPNLYDPYSCSVQTMEMIIKNNNLNLEKLAVNFDEILPLCQRITEFEKRLVSVINRILEQSRETLKMLSFSYTVSFLRGIKMPSCMTELRELEIVEELQERRDTKATIFSKGCSLSKTFPKLTCVSLVYFSEGEFIDYNSFYQFLNCLNFQADDNPILSLSVSTVILSSDCFLFPETEEALTIPEFILQRVRKFFPNARIELDA